MYQLKKQLSKLHLFKINFVRSDHPFILSLVVVLGLPTIIEDLYWLISGSPNWIRIPLLLLHITSIIILTTHPLHGCWMVVLCFCIDNFAPFETSLSTLFLAFTSLGIISYYSKKQGILSSIILFFSIFTSHILLKYQIPLIGNTITLFISISLSVISGISFRLKMQRDNTRIQKQLMQKNIKLAASLHDYTCNELNNIIMLSNLALDNKAGQTDIVIRYINNAAITALSTTRSVISQLNQNVEPNPENIPNQMKSEQKFFYDMLHEQYSILRTLGFEGTLIISPNLLDGLSKETISLITGLIRELFGNIIKHANPEQGFSISLAQSHNEFIITLCDTPISEDNPTQHNTHSGLYYYYTMIRNRNGIWKETRDDMWSIYISIPCSETHITTYTTT